MTPTQTHRHWVAVPTFALLAMVVTGTTYALMLPSTGSVLRVQAQLTGNASGGASERIMRQGQDVLFVSTDTSIRHGASEGWDVVSGPVLIGSKSMFTFTVGDMWLRGMNGAAYVTRKGDSVTVAALSTPVTILQKETLIVVPVSYQWTGTVDAPVSDSSLQVLPADFVQEQTRKFVDVLPEPTISVSTAEPLSDVSFLLLPGASARRDQATVLTKVQELFDAIRSRKTALANDILRDTSFTTAVTSLPNHETLLATFLSLAADREPSLVPVLLPLFYQDRTDFWLLAAFHPIFVATTWVSPIPTWVPEDVVRQSLFTFFQADTQPAAFSEVSTQKWHDHIRKTVQTSKDAPVFVETLLVKGVTALNHLRQLGYPERFGRYRSAFIEAGYLTKDTLSDVAKESLATIQTMEASVVPPAPSASAPIEEAVSSAPEAPMPAAEAKQMVQQMLKAANAAITVHTDITANETGIVSVNSVLFASKTGDAIYSFNMNVRTQEVFNIVKNDERQSIPLPWEKFLGWVKGE